jgi:hypothetical protein
LNRSGRKGYLNRDDILLLLGGKKVVLNWFEWNLPTDRSLVEVALLLIGLTQITFDKNQF